MKVFVRVAILAVFVVATVSVRNSEWESFKSKFGRHYNNAKEEQHRYKIFADNLRTIIEHNQRFGKGEVTFSLGVNQFADLTHEEFSEKFVGAKKSAKSTGNAVHATSCPLPDSVDWRDLGYVTPVKDQGQCGSATTFSVTGALEGANFAKTQNLVSLSEQNIQDCCPGYGAGCTGGDGTTDGAFQCVIDMGGIAGESDYTKDECAFPPGIPAGTCTSYVDVISGSEDDLKSAVGCAGPVAALIDASQVSFQLYVSGIYYEPGCSSDSLDHGVLVVGYGSSAGNDYWIVKNSWGASWGQKGYIDMARNKDNNCGIATQASYPIA